MKQVNYRDPESSEPHTSALVVGADRAPGEAERPPKRRKGGPKRRIPYPLLIPPASQIPDWFTHLIWKHAHYKARDNCGRLWRPRGFALPPPCDEWDPPIPEPIDAGERPRIPIKQVVIPDSWDFTPYALSEER